MKTQKVTIEVPVFDGYEFAGVGPAEKGGFYFDGNSLLEAYCDFDVPSLTYRKVSSWRPATVDDAIRALKGEKVKARFWDADGGMKVSGLLVTYIPDRPYPWAASGDDVCEAFIFCEVEA